jgi:Uma2 family endonuclease
MLFYDLKKTGTVFKEDFCIIYYYLTSEILSPSGKINKYENKISDILVKTGETWKIISRFEDIMQKQNEIER